MITARATVYDAGFREGAVDPDRLFADEANCLHATYTTAEEAAREIRAQWLGAGGLTVHVLLTRGGPAGSPVDVVTLTGPHGQSRAMLAAIGIASDGTEPDHEGSNLGPPRTHRSGRPAGPSLA